MPKAELRSKVKVLATQSCPTLCDSRDCCLPGSFVHGILQVRILEWIAISSSWESSQSRDQIAVLVAPALQADSLLSEPLRKLKLKWSPFDQKEGCEPFQAALLGNCFRTCALGLGCEPNSLKLHIWILGASISWTLLRTLSQIFLLLQYCGK